jgi:hypothetical protein
VQAICRVEYKNDQDMAPVFKKLIVQIKAKLSHARHSFKCFINFHSILNNILG